MSANRRKGTVGVAGSTLVAPVVLLGSAGALWAVLQQPAPAAAGQAELGAAAAKVKGM